MKSAGTALAILDRKLVAEAPLTIGQGGAAVLDDGQRDLVDDLESLRRPEVTVDRRPAGDPVALFPHLPARVGLARLDDGDLQGLGRHLLGEIHGTVDHPLLQVFETGDASSEIRCHRRFRMHARGRPPVAADADRIAGQLRIQGFVSDWPLRGRERVPNVPRPFWHAR